MKDSSLNRSTGIFIGPENGYLVLGGTTWEDNSLLKAFVSLTGTKPNVLVIPTGLMGDSEIINENEAFFIDMKKAFISGGANDIHSRIQETLPKRIRQLLLCVDKCNFNFSNFIELQ